MLYNKSAAVSVFASRLPDLIKGNGHYTGQQELLAHIPYGLLNQTYSQARNFSRLKSESYQEHRQNQKNRMLC